MTKKAVVTVGISASGKSTHAREWVAEDPANRVEINRDFVRQAIVEASGKAWSWKAHNWKQEGEVSTRCDALMATASADGKDIIVSDTNLTKSTREGVVSKLKKLGYEVELKDFPITIEKAWERDAARANGVGHSVIATQYGKYLDYSGRKKYVADTTKPPCVLFDLDGTMFHMNGKRGPFEWDKVDLDDVDDAVRNVINHLPGHWEAIAFSGRDGSCEALTRDALAKGGIIYDKLFMRAPKDMRKDTIIKEELFWKHIAENYNVQFVIDDRPSVIRMWQEIGVKTFIVGNPWIEF